MDPLALWATGLNSEVKALMASDKTNAFEGKVAAAVREITGAAAQKTAETAQVKVDLTARLKALAESETARQKAIQANEVGKTPSLRVDPNIPASQIAKSYAWINPLLSIMITLGFLVLVFLLMFFPLEKDAAGKAVADNQVFNIALGALATAFATVIAFGSSSGSKEKDAVLAERSAQDARRQ